MKLMTFKGGVHPAISKLTAGKPIETAKEPSKVIIPLQQHIGAPCKPIVKPGDEVKIGQKIGECPEKTCSAPVHSSVCGKVLEIKTMPSPNGTHILSVIIENNHNKEKITLKKPTNPEEIINTIKEAGIVGMGGACFPTHIKLSPPKECPIDNLIVNGAECEPYLTCDHRLMLEKTDDLLKGIKIIMDLLQMPRAFIGIEENKEDAIKLLTEKNQNKFIKITPVQTKYPQGAEKTLIKTILNREVPPEKLPMNCAVVVQNIATICAIHDAVNNGNPLTERIVTITGDVKQPKNLRVKIGTPFKDIIEQCGGFKGEPKLIISGGPMMGIAQYTDDISVTKGTGGILVLNKAPEEERMPCIRCGKCIDVCPMGLMPTMIAKNAEKLKFDIAEQYHAMDCHECGSCEYICPSKIPLVELIKYAKQELCKK